MILVQCIDYSGYFYKGSVLPQPLMLVAVLSDGPHQA